MADKEHLAILKKGVDAWNAWREKNPGVRPSFSGADLSGAGLSEANLSEANLSEANLSKANLSEADLSEANLSRANLSGTILNRAILRGAGLSKADLSAAILSRANLSGANLNRAILRGADLRGANLSQANLSGANLRGAHLSGADLGGADLSWTTFADVDLSTVKGLDTVEHLGPSTIGIDTIYKSRGNIPEVFLRGCGVPDTFIEYMASLVGKPIEFYSCFISYSTKNQDFADRLYADLQNKGVRCWFAPENLKIGDRFRQRIDESIKLYDKLLLILSEESITSQWVEAEVDAALEKERRQEGRTVLFPVTIDSAAWDTDQAWASFIRRNRHIGAFSNWKDHDAYQKAFDRLLRDLKAKSATAGKP